MTAPGHRVAGSSSWERQAIPVGEEDRSPAPGTECTCVGCYSLVASCQFFGPVMVGKRLWKRGKKARNNYFMDQCHNHPVHSGIFSDKNSELIVLVIGIFILSVVFCPMVTKWLSAASSPFVLPTVPQSEYDSPHFADKETAAPRSGAALSPVPPPLPALPFPCGSITQV